MKKLLLLLCLIPFVLQAADYEGLVNPSTGAGYTLTLPLTHEDGGLEADVSSYSGILAISSGATYDLDTLAELNTALGGISLVDTGTLTDAKYCTWDATGSEIDCNSEGGSGGGVSATGTPVDNQIAVWTGAAAIEGTSGLTYDSSTLGVTGLKVNGIGSFGDSITAGTLSYGPRALNLISTDAVIQVTRISTNIDSASPGMEFRHATSLANAELGSLAGYDYRWDIYISSAGLSIRDRKNGDVIPFVVQNGTPSNTFFVNYTGKVGIGTATPQSLLSLGNVSYTFAASGLSLGDGDSGLYESADDVLQTRIAGVDVAAWSSAGLNTTLPITHKQQSSDPAEPAVGKCVTWASDGTGKGDAGDFLIACNVGGSTTWGTLFDASSGTAW